MTKSRYIYTTSCLLLLFLFGSNASAQFINIQIRVEPELTAKVEQDLKFGNIISNSGKINIGLGDANMGIFSIKALYTQSVYIELNFPDVLENSDPSFDDEIPLFLEISYNNKGIDNINSATYLSDNEGFISIYQTTVAGTPKNIWQDLFLYIYGTLDVGDIPNGVYEGEVQLIVYYD